MHLGRSYYTVKSSSTLFLEAAGYSVPLRPSIRWHRTPKNTEGDHNQIVKLTQVNPDGINTSSDLSLTTSVPLNKVWETLLYVVPLHGNTRYIACLSHPDSNVLRLLGQRLPETGNLTPTGLVSAGRPRSAWKPVSEYATTAAVRRQPWISLGYTRTGIAGFTTISWAPATDLGQHICFQILILYGCNFANGKDVKNLWVSPFYTLALAHTQTRTHRHAHTDTHTHPFQITFLNRSTNRHSKTYTVTTRTRT